MMSSRSISRCNHTYSYTHFCTHLIFVSPHTFHISPWQESDEHSNSIPKHRRLTRALALLLMFRPHTTGTLLCVPPMCLYLNSRTNTHYLNVYMEHLPHAQPNARPDPSRRARLNMYTCSILTSLLRLRPTTIYITHLFFFLSWETLSHQLYFLPSLYMLSA